MTSFTTDINAAPQRGLMSRLQAGLWRMIEAHGERHSRRAQVLALEALSDEDLAVRGLRRDEIAYHVFRDKFYS